MPAADAQNNMMSWLPQLGTPGRTPDLFQESQQRWDRQERTNEAVMSRLERISNTVEQLLQNSSQKPRAVSHAGPEDGDD